MAAKKKVGPPKKPGPKGTAIEKGIRDGEIFRAWLRGASIPTLAASYDLGHHATRRIIKEQKGDLGAMFRGQQPVEIIEDWLLRMEAAIDELAQAAAKSRGSARITAISRRLDAMTKVVDVMQSTGILPNDLGTLRVELDARKMATDIVEIFDRYEDQIPAQAKLDVVRKLNPSLNVEIGEDGYLVEITDSDDLPVIEAGGKEVKGA